MQSKNLILWRENNSYGNEKFNEKCLSGLIWVDELSWRNNHHLSTRIFHFLLNVSLLFFFFSTFLRLGKIFKIHFYFQFDSELASRNIRTRKIFTTKKSLLKHFFLFSCLMEKSFNFPACAGVKQFRNQDVKTEKKLLLWLFSYFFLPSLWNSLRISKTLN